MKTAYMTAGFSGLCGLAGWFCSSVWAVGSDLDLHTGRFVFAVTFVLSPFLIFPLVRKTHLLVRAHRELEILANTDALTGVANRRHFYEASEALVQGGPEGSEVAAVMLDIDEFKALNDTHGHAAGDAVLKIVASRLRERLDTDVDDVSAFGRVGGEEFAIILTGKSALDATRIAQGLVEAVRTLPIDRYGRTLAVTVSAGTAIQRLPCVLDALISEADAALYAAKSAGRDRVLAADNKISAEVAAGRAVA
ncbi:GGDEF domain-containing protein [Sinorhizobium medicae]|nr:GGDEF domain-containing protein [Sinorhizobium medicae]